MRNPFGFVGCACALLAALAPPALAAPVTYSFDPLTLGTIVGQDNWGLISGSSLVIANGSGVNPSRVAQNPGVVAANVVSRQNNGAFTFGSFTGGEQTAFIQLDLRINYASPENFSMYLGDSVSGNYSPHLGFNNPAGTPQFGVREAGFGPGFSVPVPARVNPGDWVRLHLDMDFLAAGGDGLGNVFYMDLTLGDASFIAVAGLQNVPLGMTNPGSTASLWDEMFMRTDLNTIVSVGDNLTIQVPEPGSLALAGAGGLMAALVSWRRRRLWKHWVKGHVTVPVA